MCIYCCSFSSHCNVTYLLHFYHYRSFFRWKLLSTTKCSIKVPQFIGMDFISIIHLGWMESVTLPSVLLVPWRLLCTGTLICINSSCPKNDNVILNLKASDVEENNIDQAFLCLICCDSIISILCCNSSKFFDICLISCHNCILHPAFI